LNSLPVLVVAMFLVSFLDFTNVFHILHVLQQKTTSRRTILLLILWSSQENSHEPWCSMSIINQLWFQFVIIIWNLVCFIDMWTTFIKCIWYIIYMQGLLSVLLWIMFFSLWRMLYSSQFDQMNWTDIKYKSTVILDQLLVWSIWFMLICWEVSLQQSFRDDIIYSLS